jgi:predicted nucleic acid-binding protein
MTRYVIGPDVALRLAEQEAVVAARHQLVAPALLRSQVLSLLYERVRHGEISRQDAERRLDYLRGLRIRLLGDRVLQRVAWKVADQFGWHDTYVAEYIAVTQLQADAFVTQDAKLARTVKGAVKVATVDDLLGGRRRSASG